MAWVLVDDGFSEHPKIAQVGAFGAWLQIQALCYCNRNLTDGFVPLAIAESFARRGLLTVDEKQRRWQLAQTCGMAGRDIDEADWSTIMLSAGLWEEVPGGYRIHDYDQYQRSKAEILGARVKSTTRQKRHRAKLSRRDSRVSHAPPNPNPNPNGEDLSFASLTQGAAWAPRVTELGFDRFWAAYPQKRHKPAAIRAWKGADGARHLEAIVAGVERWKTSDAWRRGFVEDPATFLRQRQWEDEPRRTSTAREPGRVQPTIEATRELLRHL